MKPFVKWAGGKRQILNNVLDFIKNSNIDKNHEYTYIEPFIGGGAILFGLLQDEEIRPNKVIINDLNEDLINAYRVIKSPDYIKLIDELKQLKETYMNSDKDEFYYEMRAKDRQPGWPNNMSNVSRAARMIFLNKTCYNGLYRVNSKGEFNTPIGRYQNPLICDELNLREIHNMLNKVDVEIMCGDYKNALRKAKADDIVYLDPPYDYEDDDGFTKYQMQGFTFEDFKTLKNECDKSLKNGAFIIISNNATTKVMQLFLDDSNYQGKYYDKNKMQTLRTINCKGGERKTGQEVIFWAIPNSAKDIPLPQADDINKILGLLKSDESILNDKNKITSLFEFNTNRQVSYYISALAYLGFVSNDDRFTNEAKKIKENPDTIDIKVAQKIKEIFNDSYQQICNTGGVFNDELNYLEYKKKFPNLSEVTLKRRMRTIKKWIEWSYNQLEK